MQQLPLQSSLFETPQPTISGLNYIPDFIDSATESALIKTIDPLPWITELKRRVQHYGWRYDYKARSVTNDLRIGALPDWLQHYAVRLQQAGYFSETPDQVIINEYQPGQGISAHIDCVPCFTDTIASLSLGSPCVMDFTRSKTGKKSSLLLEARSLLVLTGDARYVWQHAIAGRKTDRYNGQIIKRTRRISLTFRKVIV
ncbi:MAG: alpha-ketoglutarate-dependent dioxygenase AlkB [Alphaproteobacteria bacterium]|nr:alpha-ketoglutarate-dependent dioxygenase AlkB [Alphaproteobacteria bacterium]